MVQNVILSYKLRVLEQEAENIQKLINNKELPEESVNIGLFQISEINKSKLAISALLNRVVSKV